MKVSPPTIGQLFLGFLQIGITGFGGVLPIARRALVERRRWLSEEAFSQDLAIAQLLPGPNIVNLSVAIGLRFAGIPGAIASFTAILAMPLVILLSLLAIYANRCATNHCGAARDRRRRCGLGGRNGLANGTAPDRRRCDAMDPQTQPGDDECLGNHGPSLAPAPDIADFRWARNFFGVQTTWITTCLLNWPLSLPSSR
jgi:hypothetical protein